MQENMPSVVPVLSYLPVGASLQLGDIIIIFLVEKFSLKEAKQLSQNPMTNGGELGI